MTTITNPTQKNKIGIFCQKCLFTPNKSPNKSGNLVFGKMLPLSNLPPEVCYDFATSLSGENYGQFSKQMSSINTKKLPWDTHHLGLLLPHIIGKKKNNDYYMCGFFLFLFICTFSLIFPLGGL
jgi:hypothetical protein